MIRARDSYIYIFKVDRNQKCKLEYGQKYGAGGVDRNQKCTLEYSQKCSYRMKLVELRVNLSVVKSVFKCIFKCIVEINVECNQKCI